MTTNAAAAAKATSQILIAESERMDRLAIPRNHPEQRARQIVLLQRVRHLRAHIPNVATRAEGTLHLPRRIKIEPGTAIHKRQNKTLGDASWVCSPPLLR